MKRLQNSLPPQRKKKGKEALRRASNVQAVQKGKTVIIERGNLAIHEGKETVKETTMIGKLEDHVRENGEVNPFQEVEVSRTREWR